MTDHLKAIYEMTQRYNKLGVVSDEVLEGVEKRMKARELKEKMPKLRPMDGEQIKAVRNRYGMSQSALAVTMGMSVESVSKWERNEGKPGGAALRILNTLEVKGPAAFM